MVRVGDVDDVQQEVGACGFFQRRGKSGDKFVRQVADKADGIGHEDGLRPAVLQFAPGRVEGGKELVLCVHVRFGQGVEQGGFAGVGVAGQSHGRDVTPQPRLAVFLALFLHAREATLQLFDARGEQAAVGFELRFARATQADTAFLSLQVRPAAYQACCQVVQLRQFDLQFPFVAARPLREDVQHQSAAVKHARVAQFLQIALL